MLINIHFISLICVIIPGRIVFSLQLIVGILYFFVAIAVLNEIATIWNWRRFVTIPRWWCETATFLSVSLSGFVMWHNRRSAIVWARAYHLSSVFCIVWVLPRWRSVCGGATDSPYLACTSQRATINSRQKTETGPMRHVRQTKSTSCIRLDGV